MWLYPGCIAHKDIETFGVQKGDLVIANNKHYRYPSIYQGYVSTITSEPAHDSPRVLIDNTQGTWDLNYEGTTWTVLDTTPVHAIEELQHGDVIVLPNGKLFYIKEVDVKGNIILITSRYGERNSFAIRFENNSRLRKCNYIVPMEDSTLLRIHYTDDYYRYHSIFDTWLLQEVMNNRKITQLLGLRAYADTYKSLTTAEAADFVIKNLTEE